MAFISLSSTVAIFLCASCIYCIEIIYVSTLVCLGCKFNESAVETSVNEYLIQ